MKTVKEIRDEGRQIRREVPFKELGAWTFEADRPIVRELIIGQEESRVQPLIPLRHERMSASPFTFFRGTAIIQAHDLAQTAGTPLRVWACGDAHISNFGFYASPERRLVFDLNDFDEALPAPFECDVKRFFTSIEICGRDRGFSKGDRKDIVLEAAREYRICMQEYSDSGNLEVWYDHLNPEDFLEYDSLPKGLVKDLKRAIKKANTKNSDRAFKKFTEIHEDQIRIKSDPPIIVPLRDLVGDELALYGFNHNIGSALKKYQQSLPCERRSLIDQYEPLELAHKVVGVGSVGMKAWILLMMGREDGDPLVLQVKEAAHSVLEACYGESPFAECGRRVVEGQRAIQTAGDILLGWLRLTSPSGRYQDYYVRQLWDSKGSFNLENISKKELRGLSVICARTLAHAHAKTGNRHMIAGYLGDGESFDEAMAKYAAAYADQNESDYETFIKSI